MNKLLNNYHVVGNFHVCKWLGVNGTASTVEWNCLAKNGWKDTIKQPTNTRRPDYV